MKNNIESRLRNLEIDKQYVSYLEEQLKILNDEYGLKGNGIGEYVSSGTISDSTGNQAIEIADKRIDMELRLRRARAKVNHLETLIDKLTETEATVVKLYYFHYKPMWYISQQVKFSQRQVQRIKDDALQRLMRGVYGERE